MEKIELQDGWIIFHPDFLSVTEANKLFEYFEKNTPWQHGEITLFGKKIAIPRLESFHGKEGVSYGYSGKRLSTNPYSQMLWDLQQKVEEFSGHSFNCVLLNYYRNGMDSNGWHADNEKELGKNPVIASISLGSTRRFDLKHERTGEIKHYFLNHGSLLIMGGALQHHWKHQVPKQKKITESRINLTFRFIDEDQLSKIGT